MNARNPRRNNHYTPRAHLARFVDPTDPQRRLWVYDRSKPFKDQPKLRHPSQVGKARDLYVLQTDDSTIDDELERWFSDEIDSPAASAFGSLISLGPSSLSAEERRAVARYLAAQDVRTPASRDWTRVEVQKQNPAETEAGFQRAWVEWIRGAPDRLASQIEQLGWKVIRAPSNVSFLTSDIGLAKVTKDLTASVPFAPGWSSIGGYRHWVFPLEPHSTLFLSPGVSDGTIESAKSDACRQLNYRMFEQALRYVFGSHRDGDVQSVFSQSQQLSSMG